MSENKKIVFALCLSIILCFSYIAFNVRANSSAQSLISSYGTVLNTSSVFGNNAVGTYRDQNDPNVQSISYFKAATTGSVTDIVAYISGASPGKATAALYAVNGNSPSTLLTQSSSVTIGTTSSWVDFQLSTPYTVTSGTTYGLAIMGNVALNLAVVSGTGQRTGGPGYSSYANGFANPFGTVWFNDVTGAMSIYATGTSTTPTPTPTPTPDTNTYSTPAPTLVTFGNTEIGTLANYFGTAKDASRFQLTQSGILQSITVYFANTGYTAKTAIYTDNNGAPSTLITQSNSQTVTSTGWNTFTTPQTTLTAGTYWLCTISSSNSALGKMSQSTTTNAWKPTTYANEYTSTFGTPTGYDTTPTSIYATINPTTITPTPSPTPTTKPSPTATPTPTLPQLQPWLLLEIRK